MLERIIFHKREELQTRRRAVPPAAVRRAAEGAPPPRGFSRALGRRPGVSVIAELKRCSPSAGLIRVDFHPEQIAAVYARAGAAAVSVLTDRRFFGGSPDYLRRVRRTVDLPLLCKDFIVTEYQVYEARALGADAVLLIAAALDAAQLRGLVELATELGMEGLVEVHERRELERAVGAGATLIGINNRDLRTFHTDLSVTARLAAHVPPGITRVSASGVRNRRDVLELAAHGIDAVLVGEALMRAPSIGARLRELLGEESE